jgi:hypothetical protein
VDLVTLFWIVVGSTILLAMTGVPRKAAPWVIAALVGLALLVA